MTYLYFFLSSFLLTCLLTFLLKTLALKFDIMDIPEKRSSHVRPTPRGGGVAIFMTFLLIVFFAKNLIDLGFLKVLLPGLFIVSALGLFDDIKRVSTKIRFLIQIIVALLPVSFGLKLSSVDFPGLGTLKLGLLAIPATLIWILWLTNLYNFMDGIDGIAGAEAATVSGFLFLISSRVGDTPFSYISLVILGSALGFLVHNFPPAKIFMGDVGSYFFGFFFSVMAIYASQNRQPGIPFLIFVLLLGTFILDTTVTLLRRIWKRERWFEAHRSHYYQRLVIMGCSHKQVTMLECGITCLLGLGTIFYIGGNQLIQIGVVCCSLLLLVGSIVFIEIKENRIKIERAINEPLL
jgi:UDP-N-acetylmuramyl pentapeptide phosphotransferase/UDP-N-acetylglucosamine-1-phosphate transferase